MAARPQTPALPIRDHTHYPDSDGKPMGETAAHVLNIRWAMEPIESWFENDPNVFVAGNMFIYYVRSMPTPSPDLFVVKGVPKVTEPSRRSYRTWEENDKGPDFVIEFTSASTRSEDLVAKKKLYRDKLQVSEYFLFDPHQEYLHPRLQGFHLEDGDYLNIEPVDGRYAEARYPGFASGKAGDGAPLRQSGDGYTPADPAGDSRVSRTSRSRD